MTDKIVVCDAPASIPEEGTPPSFGRGETFDNVYVGERAETPPPPTSLCGFTLDDGSPCTKDHAAAMYGEFASAPSASEIKLPTDELRCATCGWKENAVVHHVKGLKASHDFVAPESLEHQLSALRAALSTLQAQQEELATANARLGRMLETSIVRLGILRDRMEACDAGDSENHELSLFEVPAWIDEQRAALRSSLLATPHPSETAK